MTTTPTSLLPREIQKHIDERNWRAIATYSKAWPDFEIVAPEVVDAMLELDKNDRVLFFRALPTDLAVEVFALLDADTSDRLLVELTDAETRELLANLDPDDRTELLGELPGQVTQRLLTLLSPEDLREARRLLGYPEESVGRLMNPDYLAVRSDWTVGQALSHIREFGHEIDTISMLYVTERSGRLVDALSLESLVLADPEASLRSIMDYSFVCIRAHEDREEAARLMKRYEREVLPVVDSRDILLGIITFDDALEIAEAEATEDFHLTAAVAPLKRGYWETSAWGLFRSRIGWLAILVFVNLISSGVIASYEATLEAAVALAFFIPLIIDTGGNAGSQSATIMIRSMSVGDVKLDQWFRVLLKELAIGIAIGAALGLMGMVLGIFRGGHLIGMVVLATMLTMLVLTNLIGMILPFLLTRVKLDPAIASGPLITSIADAVGLVIYFGYANMILGL